MRLRFALCSARALGASALLVSMALHARAASAETEGAVCYPSCRRGFVCAPDGKCVSECNPPCESGRECHASECVAPPAASATHAAAPLDTGDDDEPRGRLSVVAGPGALIAKASAPIVMMAAHVALGEEHAFVVGPRLAVAFPSNADSFGIFGVDAGYRGTFATGTIDAGLLVLFQPQAYAGGGDALLHLGGAVGGFLRYRRFEMQLPISIGRVSPFKNAFGSSRLNAVVVTASLMGGVSF